MRRYQLSRANARAILARRRGIALVFEESTHILNMSGELVRTLPDDQFSIGRWPLSFASLEYVEHLLPESQSQYVSDNITDPGMFKRSPNHVTAIVEENGIHVYDDLGWRYYDGHRSDIIDMAFSRDERLLASASDDESVKIWDLLLGNQTCITLQHTCPVHAVAFSYDGAQIVSGTGNGTYDGERLDGTPVVTDFAVRVWDITTGECVFGPFLGHTNNVNAVAFSPERTRVVSGSVDATIRIWDVASGLALHTLNRQVSTGECNVSTVSFFPDGTKLISGENFSGVLFRNNNEKSKVCIWNVETGELQDEKSYNDYITTVAFF